jgi:diguanylate cyclase (GGDEF)-like protein
MVQRISVVMLLMLLITGAVAYYSPHRYAYRIVAFLALIPASRRARPRGDRIHLFLSGSSSSSRSSFPSSTQRVYRGVAESLSLKRVKDHLAQQLATERGRLQEVNEALAEEMLERLKAQQSELVAAQKVRLHFERTPLAVIEWDRDRASPRGTRRPRRSSASASRKPSGARCPRSFVPRATARASRRCARSSSRRARATRPRSRTRRRPRDDPLRVVQHAARGSRSGKVIGFASLVQDITERLNTERTIHYMAHHDALTGLPEPPPHAGPPHAGDHGRAPQAAPRRGALPRPRPLQGVNDTLGHDTGDFILKDVARRLVSCVREVDTVSREGGDEFVIILPDLEMPESARVVADKILRELTRPVEIGGHEIHVTPSIGISHYPNDATDVNQLLKHADNAMYQAKDAGRNTVRFFTNDLNFLLSKRLEIESRLRKAIENEEFFLRYQPQVELATGRICGMEALIRWNDPQKGEIWPKDFIFVAEELGLIVPDRRVGLQDRVPAAAPVGDDAFPRSRSRSTSRRASSCRAAS